MGDINFIINFNCLLGKTEKHDIDNDSMPLISAAPIGDGDDDLFHWEAAIIGPVSKYCFLYY
ncbi:hypothetical protein RhiirA5_448146 [Rhizophagus irregularis]|uniref:UBC core domain-containing protein n=1 Tax=Rhizophagus irregularis TaxID=588596 RepID=A0A2N0NAV2_9GLOM|nr:hypothetical protein RhiirA5_448146 [Rhizophagus irregularis]